MLGVCVHEKQWFYLFSLIAKKTKRARAETIRVAGHTTIGIKKEKIKLPLSTSLANTTNKKP